MKQVKWLTSERVIPNCGVASPNEFISLPDGMADAYVAQGEAEFPKLAVKRDKPREGGE